MDGLPLKSVKGKMNWSQNKQKQVKKVIKISLEAVPKIV